MLGDALGTEGGCAGVGVRECRYWRQHSVWAAVEGGALNSSSGRARATAMARRTWEWLAPVQGDQAHREACGKHVGLGWAPLGCFDRDECSNHRPFATTENAPKGSRIAAGSEAVEHQRKGRCLLRCADDVGGDDQQRLLPPKPKKLTLEAQVNGPPLPCATDITQVSCGTRVEYGRGNER